MNFNSKNDDNIIWQSYEEAIGEIAKKNYYARNTNTINANEFNILKNMELKFNDNYNKNNFLKEGFEEIIVNEMNSYIFHQNIFNKFSIENNLLNNVMKNFEGRIKYLNKSYKDFFGKSFEYSNRNLKGIENSLKSNIIIIYNEEIKSINNINNYMYKIDNRVLESITQKILNEKIINLEIYKIFM